MKQSLIADLGAELLDDPEADPELVETNVRNIALANRWLGGRRALHHGLRRALEPVVRGTELTLLDIGTGAGDLPAAVVAWGRRRGLRIVPLGLERVRAAARFAAAQGLPTFMACASAFPLRPKSVDIVLVSQVVHHFHRAAAVELLRDCDRLARKAVIMVDLKRSRVAQVAFWLGAQALGFDPTTVQDGLTSIQRGFTPTEVQDLIESAGVSAEVASVAPYRLVAVWNPGQQEN